MKSTSEWSSVGSGGSSFKTKVDFDTSVLVAEILHTLPVGNRESSMMMARDGSYALHFFYNGLGNTITVRPYSNHTIDMGNTNTYQVTNIYNQALVARISGDSNSIVASDADNTDNKKLKLIRRDSGGVWSQYPVADYIDIPSTVAINYDGTMISVYRKGNPSKLSVFKDNGTSFELFYEIIGDFNQSSVSYNISLTMSDDGLKISSPAVMLSDARKIMITNLDAQGFVSSEIVGTPTPTEYLSSSINSDGTKLLVSTSNSYIGNPTYRYSFNKDTFYHHDGSQWNIINSLTNTNGNRTDRTDYNPGIFVGGNYIYIPSRVGYVDKYVFNGTTYSYKQRLPNRSGYTGMVADFVSYVEPSNEITYSTKASSSSNQMYLISYTT